MGFFADLFEGKTAKIRKNHFRNMCAVAMADGVVTDGEAEFLVLAAARCGVTPDEARRVLANPGRIEFVAADSDSDRAEQLIELVHLMMVDGEIDQRELAFCMTLAVKLGFRADDVRAIVGHTIEAVNSEQSVEHARRVILSLLR